MSYTISKQFCESDCYYEDEYLVTISSKWGIKTQKSFTDYDMALSYAQKMCRR